MDVERAVLVRHDGEMCGSDMLLISFPRSHRREVLVAAKILGDAQGWVRVSPHVGNRKQRQPGKWLGGMMLCRLPRQARRQSPVFTRAINRVCFNSIPSYKA